MMHRDIKTANVFLGGRDTIKIGDFGIACMTPAVLNTCTNPVGTPMYMVGIKPD